MKKDTSLDYKVIFCSQGHTRIVGRGRSALQISLALLFWEEEEIGTRRVDISVLVILARASVVAVVTGLEAAISLLWPSTAAMHERGWNKAFHNLPHFFVEAFPDFALQDSFEIGVGQGFA